MLAVERPETPKYKLCKGREEGGGGGAINRVGAFITKNTVPIWPHSHSILINFSRPKVTLKTIAKVNKLDAGTPSYTQPPKPFSIVSSNIVSIKCENISQKGQKWPR